MSKINPLYILGLLVIFFLFSVLQLSKAKEEYKEQANSYQETRELALRLDGIKSVYTQEKVLQSKLDQLIKQLQTKGVELSKTESKKSTVISAMSIDLANLNTLMGKILNGSYQIKEINLQHISDEKARLRLEIQW
jgi:biopolymer transport protein ExbB/TolQ